jgi:hypothetical protein
MKKLFACLLIVVPFSLVTAQKSFTYKFQDAAIGPEFSRSYQIDVSKTNVHFLVFGADKPLIDENRAINKDHYKAFVNNVEACYLNRKSETQSDGCTGGTTEAFIITNSNGGKAVDGYVIHCGGVDSGNLKGSIEQAASFFRAMVPGFDYKLSTTRK